MADEIKAAVERVKATGRDYLASLSDMDAARESAKLATETLQRSENRVANALDAHSAAKRKLLELSGSVDRIF